VLIELKPLLDKFLTVFKSSDRESFWEYLNIQAIPFCKGEITEMEFWKRIARDLGKNISDNTFKDLWTKDFEKLTHINKEVQDIILLLKQNYKIAVISDTIKEHAEIEKKRGVFELFNVVVLSYEVKLTKEDKEIFLLATSKLGVKPEECVFIDDIQRFIDTAESLGMKTILFKNAEQLKNDLIKLGITL
jgi:putative hydrolase of the HAD superfamily